MTSVAKKTFARDLLLADDRNVRINPLAVWNAIASARGAGGGWRAPEPDLVEIVKAVDRAAFVSQ